MTTGNSHHLPNSTNVDGDVGVGVAANSRPKDDSGGGDEGGGGGGGGGGGHEKSVLQAKLTKLAIQIGYAGK